MFVYADQAENYQCTPCQSHEWCSAWNGFGTEYAYVQTGQFGYVNNGTTLAITKQGSGIAERINPCLRRFMATEEYYTVCKKHGLQESCYPNDYFQEQTIQHKEYNKETNEHSGGDCSTGY